MTILQREENLAGRAAAGAVRTRIDWQYLLGLPLDDPGFDRTVLSGFRNRVADAGLEQVVLDALLARLAASGLVRAGGKQRTDFHPCHRRGGGAEPAGCWPGKACGAKAAGRSPAGQAAGTPPDDQAAWSKPHDLGDRACCCPARPVVRSSSRPPLHGRTRLICCCAATTTGRPAPPWPPPAR